MNESQGLLISLPGAELKGLKLKRSIFSRAELFDQSEPLSPSLARAATQIEELARSLGVPCLYVSRAEMFTHGESLSWLRSQIGAIDDHISLSDGASVRVIPGLRNHVYFYRQAMAADVAALATLERRAPELMFTLASQINSAYRFRWGAKQHTPDPVVVAGVSEAFSRDVAFHAFHMPGQDLVRYLERLARSELVIPAQWPGRRLTFLPLTEASLADPDFLRRVARQIVDTQMNQNHALIVTLPWLPDAKANLALRTLTLLRALATADIGIPQAPSARIALAAELPSPEALAAAGAASLDMLAHDTFDFACYPASFYATLNELCVAPRRRRHNPALLNLTLEALCGRAPRLCWPPRPGTMDD